MGLKQKIIIGYFTDGKSERKLVKEFKGRRENKLLVFGLTLSFQFSSKILCIPIQSGCKEFLIRNGAK